MLATGFQVVLIEPEIPQNTGSIGRLCLATGSTLHLVDPLGFSIDHSRLKRAGLDYWEHLSVVRHASAEAFFSSLAPDAPKLLFTNKAGPTLYERRIEAGSYLIFGKETHGLADWVLNRYASDCVRIPMSDARVRGLNLAQSVAIGVYEGVRQLTS